MDTLKEILNVYRELGVEFLHMPGSAPPQSGLNELLREIQHCRLCRLAESKSHYVPGEGSPTPPILFLGEGPGETEDRFGRPFIGAAGQLLDRIVERMGYSRDQVYITNVVKCRPPENREPAPDEALACRPFLERQIALLQPRVIVCLGKVAINHLLGESFSITKVRGQQFSYQGIPVIPTYHPAYILHKKVKEEVSKAKWEVWEDMKVVLGLLGKQSS